MSEQVKISLKKAIEMLPEGEYVHTFRSNGPAIIGADWKRDEIVKLLEEKKDSIIEPGEQAQAMDHGIAVFNNGWLFIVTKKEMK